MRRQFRWLGSVWLCLLCALPLVAGARVLEAQDEWSRYKPGTIGDVIQQHDSTIRADHVAKHLSLIVSGDDFARIARVTYRGNSRPIDPKRQEVVRQWSLTFLRDTSAVEDFHREYLFAEGKRQLWLPVQDGVAGYLARELRQGQLVSLYVIWAGAYYEGQDITWAFLVNEFKAGTPAR